MTAKAKSPDLSPNCGFKNFEPVRKGPPAPLELESIEEAKDFRHPVAPRNFTTQPEVEDFEVKTPTAKDVQAWGKSPIGTEEKQMAQSREIECISPLSGIYDEVLDRALRSDD